MTSEDLGCKPSAIKQGKFEYSPLGKIFNRGLDEDDQKKGLFRVEHDKDVDQKNNKTTCLWLFKTFKSRGKRYDGWNRRCKKGHQRKKKFTFIGSNREKFNFNKFRMP